MSQSTTQTDPQVYAEMVKLRRDLDSTKLNLKATYAELKRRSKGATMADTRIARIERDIAAIDRRIKAATGSTHSSPQIKAITDELKRLNDQGNSAYNDLNQQLLDLKIEVRAEFDEVREEQSKVKATATHARDIAELAREEVKSIGERVDHLEDKSNDLAVSLGFGAIVAAIVAAVLQRRDSMEFDSKVGYTVLFFVGATALAYFAHWVYYTYVSKKKAGASTAPPTKASKPDPKKPGALRRAASVTMAKFRARKEKAKKVQSTSNPTPVHSADGPDNHNSGSSGSTDNRTPEPATASS